MMKKNSVNRNIFKSPIKSYISERGNSNQNMRKKVNNFSHRQNNRYHLINSYSVKKGNIINSPETVINNDKINKIMIK